MGLEPVTFYLGVHQYISQLFFNKNHVCRSDIEMLIRYIFKALWNILYGKTYFGTLHNVLMEHMDHRSVFVTKNYQYL